MRNNQDELCRSSRALLLVAAALVLAVGGIGCRRKEPAADRGKEDESAVPSLPGLAKLSQEAQIEAAQRAAVPVAKEVDLGSGVTMKFVFIPPGSFMMGSEDEKPVHRVTISRGFYMGIHEVTNAQYHQFKSGHSSRDWKGNSLNGPDQPVVCVSWDDAKAFCDWLSRKTGSGCRLPTEAEWEYACRAGTRTAYPWGDRISGRHCNFADKNSGFSWRDEVADDGHAVTAPVGSYRASTFGLYDMIGNVGEWCADWYDSYYASSPSSDPKGPASGRSRVLRGGSWINKPGFCRSANRLRITPDELGINIGFRVVLRSPRP